jgi:TfoX/Sxy family transcriptional regulator of competence genes
MTDEPAAYRAVAEGLLADDPEVNEGQMMGNPSLKRGSKMFGGLWKGRLLVRIGRDRVGELVAAGRAEPFDPSGQGRAMKDWAVLAPAGDWLELAEEAKAFLDA